MIAGLYECKDLLIKSIWRNPTNWELKWSGVRPAPYTRMVRKLLDILFAIVFPGFSGLSKMNVVYQTGKIEGLIDLAHEMLVDLIKAARECNTEKVFEYAGKEDTMRGNKVSTGRGRKQENLKDDSEITRSPSQIALKFLKSLPECRKLWLRDLHSAIQGDPAATSRIEILSCYPGFYAVFVYRIAHALYLLEIPLLPRIMSEIAHGATGIDIHPAAVIDGGFFIDHGTGVVIGATCEIGENCRLYQGVTLGAKRFKTEPGGALVHGYYKRHPTLKNNVTVFANAAILGGDVVVGNNVVINAGVVLTKSVGDNTRVSNQPPILTVRQPNSDDYSDDDPFFDDSSGI